MIGLGCCLEDLAIACLLMGWGRSDSDPGVLSIYQPWEPLDLSRLCGLLRAPRGLTAKCKGHIISAESDEDCLIASRKAKFQLSSHRRGNFLVQ